MIFGGVHNSKKLQDIILYDVSTQNISHLGHLQQPDMFFYGQTYVDESEN